MAKMFASMSYLAELKRDSLKNHSHRASIELLILSILQGNELEWRTRVEVAQTIARQSEAGKISLVSFLQAEKGAVQCAMENNACKVFQCPPGGLSTANWTPSQLISLWESIRNHIIPSLQSIIYPFHDISDTRLCILRCFRDHVVVRLLSRVGYRIPAIEHILYTLLLETKDQSKEYRAFEQIVQRIKV